MLVQSSDEMFGCPLPSEGEQCIEVNIVKVDAVGEGDVIPYVDLEVEVDVEVQVTVVDPLLWAGIDLCDFR